MLDLLLVDRFAHLHLKRAVLPQLAQVLPHPVLDLTELFLQGLDAHQSRSPFFLQSLYEEALVLHFLGQPYNSLSLGLALLAGHFLPETASLILRGLLDLRPQPMELLQFHYRSSLRSQPYRHRAQLYSVLLVLARPLVQHQFGPAHFLPVAIEEDEVGLRVRRGTWRGRGLLPAW